MTDLEHLGGVLEYFAEDEKRNPHLSPARIEVIESGKTIARGKATDIINDLRDMYDRKILEWDAFFQNVTLTI